MWVSGTHCNDLHLSLLASFGHSVTSSSLQPHGLQHIRLPWPSPSPGVHSDSCPSSRWCHPTISSSVVPFSSYLHSFLTSGSFPMSQLFPTGGQNIGVSESFLTMYIQGWLPLGLTGLISLQSKQLSRVFSSTTDSFPQNSLSFPQKVWELNPSNNK